MRRRVNFATFHNITTVLIQKTAQGHSITKEEGLEVQMARHKKVPKKILSTR
jgi:hypothetical protein